ncbi:MAG: MerR family transcriptional regulator [Thermoanaerobaculales bacterium]|nr:MerR family transcriptional regulator [Thermoanaerobaculales bacterium]
MKETPVLPDGQETFKLNEVCKLANVQPYMLRFWGTEFAKLEAAKSGTGQRQYSRQQVETILEIRHFLFEEGLTIAGARKRIENKSDKGKDAGTKAADAGESSETKRSRKPSAAAEEKKQANLGKELDNKASENVKTLLATLSEIRGELATVVADIKDQDTVGT